MCNPLDDVLSVLRLLFCRKNLKTILIDVTLLLIHTYLYEDIFIVYLCRAHKMRSYGIQKYNIKSLQTCQNVKNMSSRCLRLQ